MRRRLDDWRFWIGTAYFALAFLMVWLYVVNGRTTREVATRKATIAAQAETQYRQCLGSIPALSKINTHLRGVNDLASALVVNSAAVLSATTPGDPQFVTRTQNLGRIKTAASKIAAVAELPVPTRADCVQRRRVS